jgi:hypothetical protein
LRLTQNHLNEIIDEFHAWRYRGRSQHDTLRKMMETFLHYVASGGYYRQVHVHVGFAVGRAKSAVVADLRKVAEFFCYSVINLDYFLFRIFT